MRLTNTAIGKHKTVQEYNHTYNRGFCIGQPSSASKSKQITTKNKHRNNTKVTALRYNIKQEEQQSPIFLILSNQVKWDPQ